MIERVLSMYRIVVYNIAYGTGSPANSSANIFNIIRYIMPTRHNFNKISRFLNSTKADIIGLTEVDTGSFRMSMINQAEKISKYMNNYHHTTTKYGENIPSKIIPILRKQGNAVLTKDVNAKSIYHYFPGGFKKLIIEVDMGNFCFFLLHLALSQKARKFQLEHMSNLLSTKKVPVIIGGDFNTFRGAAEIEDIQKTLNLINPNLNHESTYPSWGPKHQLDFILCSKEIKIKNFEIPKIKLSDHMPVILDFEI